MKNILKEMRPDGSDSKSFPSGHTATAFMGAELLRMEYEDSNPWIGVAGYVSATLTGFLRVYNNRHYLTDVLAGAGIGILSARIAYWLYPAIKEFLIPDKIGCILLSFSPYCESGRYRSVGASCILNF